MNYHKDGEVPKDNSIFVFGSNLAGRHGKGAAKIAKDKFGAIYGIGQGLTGKSYAIPTKDKVLKSLSIKEINENILEFVSFVKKNSHLKFFITAVGCGLAGYKDEDIAPLFRILKENKNCSFPDRWEVFLN